MIEFIRRSRLFWTVMRAIQLPRLLNFYLRLRKPIRFVPGSRLRYRLRFVDTVIIARDIFHDGEYALLKEDTASIRRFIDLGCNVGLFALYLCSLRGNKGVEGILIDANLKVLEEAQANLHLNGLHGISAIHGIAAVGSAGEAKAFWVTVNTTASTDRQSLLNTFSGAKKTMVKIIDALHEFESRFGADARVDLLKVDIEGAEFEYLKSNESLLKRCDRIIVECHKPQVTLERLQSILRDQGFELVGRYGRNPGYEVGYFQRPTERI